MMASLNLLEYFMKYLTFIPAIMLALSAHAQAPKDVEQALKECQAVVDAKKDRTAFNACMKAKGFDRPDKPKS